MNSPRTTRSTKTTPPLFITKLYEIISNPSPNCTWSSNGNTFEIQNVNKFSSQYLKDTFQSDTLPSFIRQLHLHGFTKILKPPGKTTVFIFHNPHFTRHSTNDDLCKIIKQTTTESIQQEQMSTLTIELATMQQEMHNLQQTNQILASQLLEANHRADVAEMKLGKQNNNIQNNKKTFLDYVLKRNFF